MDHLFNVRRRFFIGFKSGLCAGHVIDPEKKPLSSFLYDRHGFH